MVDVTRWYAVSWLDEKIPTRTSICLYWLNWLLLLLLLYIVSRFEEIIHIPHCYLAHWPVTVAVTTIAARPSTATVAAATCTTTSLLLLLVCANPLIVMSQGLH